MFVDWLAGSISVNISSINADGKVFLHPYDTNTYFVHRPMDLRLLKQKEALRMISSNSLTIQKRKLRSRDIKGFDQLE